ncbi:uncharacterized protein LOC113207675 [Frankliniella occidentalis]|uniref:Uncharacterized protein LOC113207675 n=1 Tax=Frankliniella occidentalis TaxID=133901 RepID=A0A6J1SHD2_FRAOC|nr:uncharacterized protein LOC113207675 [Frankliniella occidentalis]
METQSSNLSIEQLPDDVLLGIMWHLDLEDIFTCRLVCKKLGALALHPDVWRHRGLHLPYPDDNFVWACPVLRLAPCLEWLVVELPTEGCQLAYTMTRCAVSFLNLDVRRGGSMHAAAMIRNQEALGRLRNLEISMPRSASAVLLGAVALASGLEKLTVTALPSRATSIMLSVLQHRAASTPSLKCFNVDITAKAESFVHFVLASHAATLEDVNLNVCSHLSDVSCSYSDGTVPLLAGIANLQKLECPLLPGLGALAASESLTTLIINVCESPERRAVVGAWQLLRRSKQLRDVTLHFSVPLDSGLADVGGEPLVRALVSSGPSRLESLTMSTSDRFDSPEKCLWLLEPVLGMLPLLPALRSLHVVDASDELLSRITPDTAPALERLVLEPYSREHVCAHGWLHRDAVKKLFAGFPSLRLIVPSVPKNCPGDYCNACALGCDCDLREWFIEDCFVGILCCTLMQRIK